MNIHADKTTNDNPFWHKSIDQQLTRLGSSLQGLSQRDAEIRLKRDGANRLNDKKKTGAWRLLLAQFKSSIILLLLFATGISFYLKDHVDAIIILSIVLISGLLGFWQEKGAANAVEKLLAMVEIKAAVLRDGVETEISADELVVGDVIVLRSGDVVPADCLLLEAENLFVDEAALTGESFPAEKIPDVLAIATPLAKRSNALWMGTHVQSGSASALIVAIASATEFGKLSAGQNANRHRPR
ncbi:MAG: HAD-IC family P-type ATPase [Methylovulum sp.]|uniref:HAD-IC family P-type ATPase n=1 Tax=Methylovulum sp. TaxID=1916980 RepID=UPI0026380F4C|nr:HAD-IC family P-type ATPase [Methylovulum sp.]MDD2725183.1 HAD-IC family P-type ATPase [Methylovulum sp.]MDD5124384.1 HAD-IC family P-type ATPase [Methylovulum sp.]